METAAKPCMPSNAGKRVGPLEDTVIEWFPADQLKRV
jgi:hypothetical protein